MIDRLVIYLLLAGSVIFGAIVLWELKSTATETAAPSGVAGRADSTSALRRQPSTRLDDLLAQALARPLFSSTRRPPQAAANDSVVSSDLADTRLTGIVTEPGHHVAIFAVNGAKPLRLTEGEAVSGWRIESITPREVSLSGPGGTKTLEPKLDPTLSQPPPGPAPTANPNPAARLPAPPTAAQPGPAANVQRAPGVPAGQFPRRPVPPPRGRAQP
jgi:general secretion pathway protein N